MLKKKFIGRFALAVTFVSLMVTVGNFTYADEKQPEGTELTEALNLPICPACEKAPASHTAEKVSVSLEMVCPDCKKEISELKVYHCDECKKEFLACPICEGTSEVVTKAQIVKRFLQHESR